MTPAWAIGLMTGTVLDGNIDVAAIRTDGETVSEFGVWRLEPYPGDLKPLLQETVAAARAWGFSGAEPALFARAEARVTQAQSDAVATVLRDAGLRPTDIAVIGFHGQTVLHRPPTADGPGRTRQLGNGAEMAARLGIPVVDDFRSADMRAGGQGAPLSAIYHAALLERIGAGDDTAVVNLGGVANLTWVDSAGTPHAFDTGPANAPVNDWIAAHGLGDMDRDGTCARAGTVDEARLAQALTHPFFAAAYPKSLDRNDFTSDLARGLTVADGAATLTAFSAAAVGAGLDRLPKRPSRLIVAGGGRRNPQMLAELAARTGAEIRTAEDVGWRGDAIEAECFAFLAMRTLRGLPISFPLTTGVSAPLTGGVAHAAPPAA
ncbi:anhydro-N-acetylmuramic acid kinase [Stappia sp.]|uniref:anhydro-N-acetylmuramic acid kinase n=1 Tax=Stappia sp. TaxID=1870903 RepID=UPI0032D9981F